MKAELKINVNNQMTIQACSCGDSLLTAIDAAGIPLNLQCGGGGFCGKCRVILQTGTFSVNGKKIVVDSPVSVLSCQTKLESAYGEIEVPSNSIIELGGRVVTDFPLPPEPGTKPGFKLAVDIGTTTVAAIIFDGESGAILAKESMYNQQMCKGDDVSARITYAAAGDSQLHELQQLIITDTVNQLIEKMCSAINITAEMITAAAFSGNTVISHLFLGLSPYSIGIYPFKPLTRVFQEVTADSLGLKIASGAEIYLLPAIGGYLGGDVVADIYITDLAVGNATRAMIDLGTNSEIVISHHQQLFAASTAAGPAFEGAGLLYGSRAVSGAIEKVHINADLQFECEIIGGGKAKTICGSGIIDFIAEAYQHGLLNNFGRYNLDLLRQLGRLTTVMRGDNKIWAVQLQDEVVITEYDLEQVLKAKAAIFSGLQTLLEQLNLTMQDLDQVILSGGFAKYIDLHNAVLIGLLPNLSLDKYMVIGNGSLGGAYLAVQRQAEARQRYLELIDLPQVISLNEDPVFEMNYIDALMLPE
jgi:uncharacterized 2Fe-2S/4Fe-4S cluster protein (DUF4445 family)